MVAQFVQMIEELKKCENAGATTACVLQVYVYIDALAYFGMPITSSINTRGDFIKWVDRYLKAHISQPYQYSGEDVYGARCAVLHTFSSDADFHQKNPNTVKFGYSDGGKHHYHKTIDPTFAIIGVASLVNDFVIATGIFLQDIKNRIADINEQKVLQDRLNKILNTIPFLAT